jgi:hypothetical protein
MPDPGTARAPVRRRIVLAVMVLALAAALASSTDRSSPVASAPAADPATSAAPATALGPVAPTEPATPSPPAPAPTPAVDPATRLAVLTTVADVAAQAGGTVQVAVRDAAGVEVLASPGAGTPVLTASLVKLLVVQQLFARQAAGLVTLSPANLDLMQPAVTSSDDAAMSALWEPLPRHRACDRRGCPFRAQQQLSTGGGRPVERGDHHRGGHRTVPVHPRRPPRPGRPDHPDRLDAGPRPASRPTASTSASGCSPPVCLPRPSARSRPKGLDVLHRPSAAAALGRHAGRRPHRRPARQVPPSAPAGPAPGPCWTRSLPW